MRLLQTLSTERLTLEPVTPAHADETWPALDDDRMWSYFPELRPRSLEHLRTIYERREHGSPDESKVWLNYVCRERASGAVAGEVQATILRALECSYIAYAVFPAFQRRGYAREATLALIEHVRSHYGVQRFRAEMDKRNEASYRLAESLGFERVETDENDYVYELRFG